MRPYTSSRRLVTTVTRALKLLSRPEHQQHRQECLCHTGCADTTEEKSDRIVWHKHSCLCFGKVQ